MSRATLAMLLMALTVLPPLATGPSPGVRVRPELAQAAVAVLRAPDAPRVDAAPRAGAWTATVPSAVARFANDVLLRDENGRQPFVVIDKQAAGLFVVAADGDLIGQAPVLLGAARGDDSVPGIGERPIAQIRMFERTTPAGRFLAASGRNAQGEDIVWVDYAAAISMRRVRPVAPRERRLQRLASATPTDNRISSGCINVPVEFFDRVIGPLFARGPHAVYVLPEVRTVGEVFGARTDRSGG